MYAPLQVKSAYSLLKNPNSVAQLVQTAKERGYQALSLADENVLYGLMTFYQEAAAAGIKPIFSLTLTVNGLVNTATAFPLLLTAVNQQGYQNLLRLSSQKMTAADGQLAVTDLYPYLAGLALTFPVQSELAQLVLGQDPTAQSYFEGTAKQLVTETAGTYLGIHPNLSDRYLTKLADFAKSQQLPLIAWDQVDYLNPSDVFTANVLKAIASNSALENWASLKQEQGAFYLRPAASVQADYQRQPDLAAAYVNNEALVDRIQVSLDLKQTALPVFQQDSGQSSEDYLRSLALAGLAERPQSSNHDGNAYQERLERELQVICALGFADYFLIVWDIVRYAKDHQIQTGAGRGSAAGSLVAYVLGITDVDPLAYDLLFERFLNPERVSMPDIDIDWPDNRRDEILRYLHDRYGASSFAQIITFGTFAAKAALRDVGRVFGLSQKELGMLSKAVPAGKNGRKVPLKEALAAGSQLQQVAAQLPAGQLLLETAQAIENLPRNFSTHAAGVVLSDQPLVDTLPVQAGNDGYLLTQLEKGPVEALGLLKIDVLGLTNLKILAEALRLAQPALPANFDIKSVPLDDQETLALFAKGATTGVFQFESQGIRQLLRNLRVDDFEQIVAANALYRPGPSENIPAFLARRNGQEQVPSVDASIDFILAPTYGIMLYQEQVMRVATHYAGFTLAQADRLRAAMSKKKLAEMADLKEAFLAGAQAQGHQAAQSEAVFAYIERFANYGFNRSHAVAYSLLAYQLAYLKAHYPAAFYTALLNVTLGDAPKIATYLREAKDLGLSVLGPDVNQSKAGWSLQKGALRMGFYGIKGLRKDFVSEVLQIRREAGSFQSLQQFIQALPERFRQEKYLAALAKAGALDRFGYNRAEILQNIPTLLEGANYSLAILSETKMVRAEEMPLIEKLQAEKETIGLNLSGHPVDSYRHYYDQGQAQTIQTVQVGQAVTVLGLLTKSKVIRTKKGDEMAFLTVADGSGEIEITVFPKLYQQVRAGLVIGDVYLIRGKAQLSPAERLQLVGDRMTLAQLDQGRQEAPDQGTWFLRFDSEHDQNHVKQALSQLMLAQAGQQVVVLYYEQQQQKQVLEAPYQLPANPALVAELEAILGAGNAIYQPKQEKSL
ncbi:DNA polymerase III subunit alpha [Leuconostocaceae bacterium ESL0958]|nr:DNA polymerase III subunit alpha [Leuconostocaceae bacterium ESL0958]